MGLFDTITIHKNHDLPEIPDLVLETHGGRDHLHFQTKDLDCALRLYMIDENGQLKIKKTDGYFEEGDENSESIGGRLPNFVCTQEWWEDTDLTAEINFYESYSEDGYDLTGWIEYKAIIFKGELSEPIRLFKHETPRNFAEEEIRKNKEFKEKIQKQFTGKRKNHPTQEQKLIDNIYNSTIIESAIVTQEDYARCITKIKKLIEEYRRNFDNWRTDD